VIVADASAVIDFLTVLPQTDGAVARLTDRLVSSDSVHAPHLIDVEVLHVLRKMAARHVLSALRADRAVEDFLALRIIRYPVTDMVRRAWDLRHNLSAYDATYVTLAEALDCPLVTRDARIAGSGFAQIEVY
jgi:predicted nucleic acid-binding protein